MKKLIRSIGIIGDSIMKGVVFDEIIGKYKHLQDSAAALFAKTNNVEIKNHSKFGCTTDRALQNLSAILENDTDMNIVLLELGGNDCDYNWNAVCADPRRIHKPNVPYERFKRNLDAIVKKILHSGKQPLIMTLAPIDADKYFNWIAAGDEMRSKNLLEFLGDKNYIYRTQERYANALEQVAAKYNLVRVNVRDALLNIPKYSDYLCHDGIHLNERGQRFIKKQFDKVYKEYAIVV